MHTTPTDTNRRSQPQFATTIAEHAAAWDALARRLTDATQPQTTSIADARAQVRAAGQGFVLTRAQARAAGMTDARVRSLVRRRLWTAPRHAVVSPVAPAAADAPPAASEVTTVTAAALVHPGAVVSHAGAGVLHGLPLLASPGLPTLTVRYDSFVSTRSGVRIRAAGLRRFEVVRWHGVEVTSIARTVVDLARGRGMLDGLVAADAALHAGVIGVGDLELTLRWQRGWPGSRRAQQMLELVDGASESPLETLTRACLILRGVPAPKPQQWVRTHRGSFRVDLLWPDQKVIVEADGLAKYKGGWEVVVAEKRRHEALERAGYTIVRVEWDEVVGNPEQVVGRVLAALNHIG